MSYSQFTLASAKKALHLTTVEQANIFTAIPEIPKNQQLAELIQYNVPLALASNSEKARSEMIIAPILLETRKQLQSRFSLFSGINFDVDETQGLNGYCDFILSSSTEQLFVAAPVMMIVEAKNEDIPGGLGQCIAEMYAAQLFNQREENNIPSIYGTVTTGTNWRFLKLTGAVVEIDLTEYYLRDLPKILGIIGTSIQCPETSS